MMGVWYSSFWFWTQSDQIWSKSLSPGVWTRGARGFQWRRESLCVETPSCAGSPNPNLAISHSIISRNVRFNQRKKIANYPFKWGHLIEANVKSEIIYEKLTWNFHGESQHTFETNWECSWKFTVHQKKCIINTNSLLVKICLCMGKHHHHSNMPCFLWRSMNLSWCIYPNSKSISPVSPVSRRTSSSFWSLFSWFFF